MSRYKLMVFEVYDDCERLTDTKCFNSLWLRKAYMRALRARYDGDEFRSLLYGRPTAYDKSRQMVEAA